MKVDLLVIGAGRAGTTTICEHLKLHKNINFSKIKEVHYFSINDLYEKGDKYYKTFFEINNNKQTLTASADTYLLVDKSAPQKICDYNPKMKFIIMLREPIARAYSGYRYAINNGYLNNNISFLQSIDNEKNILNKNNLIEINNLCNVYQSHYYQHIKYWELFFKKENFLLLQTNELKNIEKTLDKISTYLSIEKFENTDLIKANESKIVKNKQFEQFLLNRNLFFRKILRNIIPKKIKQNILKSGFVDKLHKLNKKNSDNSKISLEEFETAKKYFENDLKKLKQEYNIDFYEN